MHPLIWIGGGVAAWSWLKNRNVAVNTGIVGPASVNPADVGVTMVATDSAPQYPAAGTVLGVGAQGNPNIADGNGGITVLGVPKLIPSGLYFDLMLNGNVYVWTRGPDGAYVFAGPAPEGVTSPRAGKFTQAAAFTPPTLQGFWR